jgi:protoporphyrinogen oxidase
MNHNTSTKHLILGAGLTGLSAGFHLKEDYAIYEKLHEVGGLCRSEEVNGFLFDYAPHILYTADPYAAALIQDLLKGNIHIQARKAYIYHGKYDIYTKFPYQAHLHGLPAEDIYDCLTGLLEVLNKPDRPKPNNYREWMYWRFGKGIAEQLMIPYAERIWTIDPSLMNFSWIDRRVPEPNFDAVLRGALHDETSLAGFNQEFWYPIEGAIEALPVALAKRVNDVHLSETVVKIDHKQRIVSFASGITASYENLIYTLPLTHLPKFIEDLPENVVQAIDGLQFNQIQCVNIGIDRPDISPYHWLYFHEAEDFIFHRISFPRNTSEKTCPPGTSSVCCEISYSEHRPLRVTKHEDLIQETIAGLIRAKILRPEDKILAADVLTVDPAYVIYDLDYEKNVKIIHDYLISLGIHPCGRFGDWQYYNMDHSIMSGKRIADLLLSPPKQ